AMSLGCGSAVFALLVHSIFDFNLQLPSNALLFLLLSSIPMMVSSHMVRAKGKARVVLKRPEQTEFLPRLRGDAPLPPAENAETLNSASEN
ncbi:MAG TPA: hypothetical protein VEZ90_16840, partial [Blastocatellia bacterium]|nr:hypothetical protein [Blastocatellia bacterium]